jgi:uncharacterized membrane protein
MDIEAMAMPEIQSKDAPPLRYTVPAGMPSDDGFEASFRREHPSIWISTLVGPFVLTGGLLGILYAAYGLQFVGRLLAAALAAFFFFGKFIILGGTSGELAEARSFFTSEQLLALVLYMDLLTASLLVFHMGFLFKLPFLGPKLIALVEDGQFILKTNPWMKRVTFIGLVVFVMFPLAATGSVGGAIFGRLLGMSRLATFVGIALGSVLGCGLMYFGTGIINAYLDRDNPVLTIGGIAFVAGLILLLNYRYRQLKARHNAAASTS